MSKIETLIKPDLLYHLELHFADRDYILEGAEVHLDGEHLLAVDRHGQVVYLRRQDILALRLIPAQARLLPTEQIKQFVLENRYSPIVCVDRIRQDLHLSLKEAKDWYDNLCRENPDQDYFRAKIYRMHSLREEVLARRGKPDQAYKLVQDRLLISAEQAQTWCDRAWELFPQHTSPV